MIVSFVFILDSIGYNALRNGSDPYEQVAALQLPMSVNKLSVYVPLAIFKTHEIFLSIQNIDGFH